MTIASGFLVSGLIGAGLNSIIMNRWRKYKLILLIGLVGTTASYFFTFLAVRFKSSALTILFPALLGFFDLPLRALDVGFMCEVAYPVSMILIVVHFVILGEALICGLSAVLYSIVYLGTVLGTSIYFGETDADGIFTYGIISSIILGSTILLSLFDKG